MRRTEPVKIGSLIERMVADNRAFTQGMLEAKALGAWREAAGPLLAEATQKITLRDGRLYVTFASAAARSEFFARRMEIRRRLNEIAGSPVVTFISVR